MNKHPRYIQILKINLRNGGYFKFSIGNPMWFIEEFKKLKGGK